MQPLILRSNKGKKTGKKYPHIYTPNISLKECVKAGLKNHLMGWNGYGDNQAKKIMKMEIQGSGIICVPMTQIISKRYYRQKK